MYGVRIMLRNGSTDNDVAIEQPTISEGCFIYTDADAITVIIPLGSIIGASYAKQKAD